MTRSYFAACTLGLEEVLANELGNLGAKDVQAARGGARFNGDLAVGYAANLWLRTAIRVQETLTEGEVHNRDDLYRLVGSLDWSRYMSVDQTLAVDASIRDTFLTDSRFAGQIVKDAVVDQFRKRHDRRPSVDRKTPDLPLKLLLRRRNATLYRDFTGASLHKRGYRPIQVKSPLNEALAAGMLLISEWDRTSLLDPMCGSGTIAIEAALLSGDRAPGLGRLFAFELWPDLDEKLWNDLRGKAEERAKAGAANIPPIEAADRHGGALALARQAAQSAEVSAHVRFTQSAVRDLRPAAKPQGVYVNPPYGERVGDGPELVESWRDLGAFLRERCAGARAHVLSGNPELTRHLGLRAERKWPLHNGPIDCRLLRYSIR